MCSIHLLHRASIHCIPPILPFQHLHPSTASTSFASPSTHSTDPLHTFTASTSSYVLSTPRIYPSILPSVWPIHSTQPLTLPLLPIHSIHPLYPLHYTASIHYLLSTPRIYQSIHPSIHPFGPYTTLNPLP